MLQFLIIFSWALRLSEVPGSNEEPVRAFYAGAIGDALDFLFFRQGNRKCGRESIVILTYLVVVRFWGVRPPDSGLDTELSKDSGPH